MEQSNTGVITEYQILSYGVEAFPYHFRFDKCQIRFINGNAPSYYKINYKASSKNVIYGGFANHYSRTFTGLRNATYTHFIVGYRSLFKIVNNEIIPAAIIDHNLDIHIQSDLFIDRWEIGLLKMIVTGATGEVTLYDNLAGEFFTHPNKRFKSLKEKREIEDQFTQKLVAAYSIVEVPEVIEDITSSVVIDEDTEFEELDEEPF